MLRTIFSSISDWVIVMEVENYFYSIAVWVIIIIMRNVQKIVANVVIVFVFNVPPTAEVIWRRSN